MNVIRSVVSSIAAACALCSCSPNAPSSTSVQAQQQEQIAAQSNSSVGMPAIENFAEKKALKSIYELRDKMKPTITYIVDMNGRTHKICDSVGYGIPYATEFTNPQRLAEPSELTYSGNMTLPQADPNALFSPTSADGTWVLCLNPDDKKITPMYVEPRIIVSEFALRS